ncbi:MAG TPA: carboxypeptidase regulatory-like domain-containing protein [Bryobacteraceae bacterium]
MKGRLIAAALVVAATTHAQTSRGTVTGTVLDPSGAVVAGARATLTGVETGVHFSTQSNEAGVYRFDAVDLGVYNLSIEHPGFKTYQATRIGVEANRVTTIDPVLEVGSTGSRVEVNGESSELLTKDSPLRGGNFQPREVRDLPLISLNPLSLARTLPGATEASGGTIWGGGYTNGGAAGAAASANGGGFSINGQRPRGNNYLLDGTDNNEIFLSGEEQVFTIADAVEEVSVQTGDFGVEFGRAGGGVFNVVTKSGTNSLHGTLLWRYQSQRFDSVSSYDKLTNIPQSVFSNNIFGFTAGGPIRKNKTFFFAGFEQNNTHSTGNYPVQVPTADAVNQLEAMFPDNPRLNLYLGLLGSIRGTGSPFTVLLGIDPLTGISRGVVQFATAPYSLPSTNDGPQWLVRIDHNQSERHRLSWRYTYDSRIILPTDVSFPGFVQEDAFSHHNFLFADSYTFSPSYTNEFRFSYARPDVNLNTLWPGSVPAATTLPDITIKNVSAPGLPSENSQFHYGNDFLFQETQTKLIGRHALRYGLEFLQQWITQQRAANDLGTLTFTDSSSLGYSAFANFLDDYSGPSGSTSRIFGAPVFHPDQLHQAYFFQDNWKVTPTLALTMGLRYDNFGQYANTLQYPAFSGFDPSQFLVRHDVHNDNDNFGPAFGLAWSPHTGSGWLRRLFGDGKTVWRGGFQISYDNLPTQLISLGPATSTPNAVTDTIPALNTGRGLPYFYEQLPQTANAPSLTDTQNPLDGNLRNPYTERWSFGFQRQLSGSTLLDVSYVGSESHELTTRADWNPRLLTDTRLYPNYGIVVAKTSQGNSSYHALQAQLNRRFAHGFQFSAGYTWSKMIDSTSDGVGNVNVQDPSGGNLTSVPVMFGGMKIDRGLSDFDRPQRLTIAYLWAVPGPRSGWSRYALAGWQFAGITTFQSGTPFSMANGYDRNNDGNSEDRPDIGNPNAPLNTRAIIFTGCSTGYQNPDTGSCVSPSSVHWVEGTGLPNASTVGRNTLRTGGTNNFDLNLTKAIPFGETRRLELRWEALNTFNHPQYVNVPPDNVLSTPPGQFLNRDFTESTTRSMWVQVKLVF